MLSDFTNRLGWSVLVVLTCSFFSAATLDGQELKSLFGRKSKQVKQTSSELTPNAGPWMVMCASFVGESAEAEAQKLRDELSQKLRLPAYIYKHAFDFSDDYEGIYYSSFEENTEVDANGQKIPKRRKTTTVHGTDFEEVAVLVGDFPSIEDGNLQKTLETIKHLPKEQLQSVGVDKNEHRPLKLYREVSKYFSTSSETKSKGPLGSAFVLPNPMLPDEYFASPTIDTTIMKINTGNENSLLDCPGNYSVRVATFKGVSTYNLEEIADAEKKQNILNRIGKPISESKLAVGDQKARLLCDELRKIGMEAYVFHDRFESYVCVGSYDWLSKEDVTGGKYLNPEIEKMILLFKGSVEDLPNQPNAFVAKSLPSLEKKGIAFDVQPVPVAVPRSTGSSVQSTRTSMRVNQPKR